MKLPSRSLIHFINTSLQGGASRGIEYKTAEAVAVATTAPVTPLKQVVAEIARIKSVQRFNGSTV
jgi:hypothetical protein